MAHCILDEKTHRFYFQDPSAERKMYILIFGDEIETLPGPAPSGAGWQKVIYRGRTGEMKNPRLTDRQALEMYFLDVGQGDAAFIVTPNNKKVLVDGGLRDRALGFLIWKYRLDQPGSSATIDYLILSHGDTDHVEGLIPILNHPQIHVKNIVHNGIAVFHSGFNTPLGHRDAQDRLTTRHNVITDLAGLDLTDEFAGWIRAVEASGAEYRSADASMGIMDIGDHNVTVEVLAPILEPDGISLKWFGDKAHTINGHSVVFRLVYGDVGVLFSGDVNTKGSKHILEHPNIATKLDAHIFKSPHHGSHDYHLPFFEAVRPMLTVVSSGDDPDHGHPRAQFLGSIGTASRSKESLLFSTEIAATFVDSGDAVAVAEAHIDEPTTLGDLDFSTSEANKVARRRFKKILPGIINVRTDGRKIYAARRVNASYQWESYGPITPIV